ncbi:MAG: lipoprotein [Zoogloeaceae bacterium]|jgi:predicted small lipoprotein YifL|nr:lipoprotein [Zoogloeaceae bacterium]
MRCCFLLLTAFTLGACGIKGSLEKPADPAPPSLHERAFGKKTPPKTSGAPEEHGEAAGKSMKSAE